MSAPACQASCSALARLWPDLLRRPAAGELIEPPIRSDRHAEEAMDEGPLRRHVVRWYGTHLPLGQHRHGLDTGQGPPCGPEALKAEHRPDQALHAAVVLLDGLIANDKFCLVRRTRLQLSWSRLSLRDRSARVSALPAEALPQGGTDAMPMDRMSDDAAGPGRPTSLGPGLPGGAGLDGGAGRRVARPPRTGGQP
jgi:hypothetical protein